jgi:hypothetical protein
MADDGYVTVLRTTDAAQGELLTEMLRREGIAARFHKVSSTLIGMPAALIEMTVDVPADSEARVEELMRDLEYTAAADEVDGETDTEGDAPSPRSGARSRALVRAGFMLFLPGTVHVCAGRPWTGGALALAGFWCICVALAAGAGSFTFGVAVATIVTIVVCDMIVGLRAAAAEVRGEHPGKGRQLATALRLLIVAVGLGVGVRTIAHVPSMWHAHVLRRFSITCSRTSVAIENGDDEDRDVTIRRVGIAVRAPNVGETIVDAPLAHGAVLRLRAGTTGRVPLEPDPELLLICAESERCRIVFAIAIESTERGPLPLDANGDCKPSWSGPGDDARGSLTLGLSNGE